MSDPTMPVPPPPGTGPVPAQQQPIGFFGALFDFSFTHFVTPMIVKAVYVLITVTLGVAVLGFIIAGLTQGFGIGLLFLVLGVLAFFVYLALARMSLEFYLAVVRMSEDIHQRLPRAN